MRKLALFAFSFAAAVLACQALALTGWTLGVLALGLVLGVLFARDMNRFRLILVSIGVAAGFFWNAFYDELFVEPARALDGLTMPVTGEVTGDPDETEYGLYVRLRIKTDGAISIPALLCLDEKALALAPGDVVTLTAELTFADTRYGEKTDYYLARGIFIRAYQAGQVTVASDGRGALRYAPARLAKAVREKIAEIFPKSAAGFITAILTGDTSGMDEAYQSALSKSGASHIVAVSGMHVSYLVGFLRFFLRRKRRAALVSIPVVLLFLAFVGFTPSAVRAGILQIFLLSAPLLRRESDPVTALGAALLCMLVQNPCAVTHVGLQLSFAASLGMTLMAEPVEAALSARARKFKRNQLAAIQRFVIASVSSSVAVAVCTAPITALHFDTISILAPVTNLLILWMLSAMFCGAVIAVAAGFLWTPLGVLAAWPVSWGAAYIKLVCTGVARLPFTVLYTVNDYIRIWLGAVYLIFGAYLPWKERKRPILPVALSTALLCLCLVLGTAEADAGTLTAAVLNVGQGQCVVLSGGGRNVVVDCGGQKDAGEMAAKYLFSRNAYRVDLLVLTHFDTDHINGVQSLMERLPVDALAMPVPSGEAAVDEIIEAARTLDIPVTYISETTAFTLGGRQVTIYGPVGMRSSNDRGISVLYSAGQFDVLVTGDLSGEMEQRLIKLESLPDIEVLVIGHHGSKYSTSETLLAAVLPEAAIISVGAGNSYGHPAEETIRRLLDFGTYIYRTDLEGTVIVRAG